MNKVAVFGKPGGGKSTLTKKLSAKTGLNMFALDLIEYRKNGERVSPEEYSKKHADLIDTDNWIIDGLGTLNLFGCVLMPQILSFTLIYRIMFTTGG